MKVFISWSGARSQKVAELFKIWLKCVIQACDPWISTKDIEGGSQWFAEINNQLSGTTVGIICLTNTNKDKPWILYEAGALTKGLPTTRVVPFLIDLAPTDIYPPLSQLNAVKPDKEGVFSLMATINSQLGEGKLTSDVLNKVFETNWPEFEMNFADIISSTPEVEKVEQREEKDILSEILLTVRDFDRRIRQVESRPTSAVGSQHEKEMTLQRVAEGNMLKFICSYHVEHGKVPKEHEVVSESGINYLGTFTTPTVYSFAQNSLNAFAGKPRE